MSKSREYFMVDCLYDEMQGHLANQRFTKWEMDFVASLNAEFFNNENFKLSKKQAECLENIWKK